MKRIVIAIVASVMSVATFSIVFSLIYAKSKETQFVESGYILNQEPIGGEKQYFFSAGTEYGEKYPDSITFDSKSGDKVVIPEESFIHYDSGSVGALTSGVFINLADFASTDYVNHYSSAGDLVFRRNNDGYDIETSTGTQSFQNILWKLSDKKYIILMESVTLMFGEEEQRDCGSFVEVTQMDEGILSLQTAENIWMTMSENCYVMLDHDVKLNLSNQTVEDNQNIMLYLSQLAPDSASNVTILTETWNRRTPLFKVDSQDGEQGLIGAPGATGAPGTEGTIGEEGEQGKEGEEGNTGDIGETGEEGESGTKGEQGTAGEIGKQGKQGQQGTVGSEGIRGNTGSNGQTGSSGTAGLLGENGLLGMIGELGMIGLSGEAGAVGAFGGNGAPGASGARGLSGDSSLTETGGVAEQAVPPTMSLSEFVVTSNSMTATINVIDNDEMLHEDSAELYIYEVGSNRVINLNDEIDNPSEVLSEAMGSGYTLNYDQLKPDTQYRLAVYAEFEYNGSVQKKEYINRNFYTDSTGVFVTKLYAEENNLHFTVANRSNQMMNQVELFLFEAPNGRYEFDTNQAIAKVSLLQLAAGTSKNVDIIEQNVSGNLEALKSDTEYLLRFQIGTSTGTISSNDIINATTLKRTPTQGKPLAIANRSDRCFELYPQQLTDPDNSIQSYQLRIFNAASNTLVKSVESRKSTIVVPIDGVSVQREKDYVAEVVLIAYDNEKYVSYKSERSDVFSIHGDYLPNVYFMTDKPIQGNDGQISYEDGHVQFNRIDGTIVIDTESCSIRCDEQHPVTVEISAPLLYYKKTDYTDSTALVEHNNKRMIPIKEVGIMQDTTYVFSVWGYVDLTNENIYEQRLLGTCAVKTPSSVDSLNITFLENNDEYMFATVVKIAPKDNLTEEEKEYLNSNIGLVQFDLYEGGTQRHLQSYVMRDDKLSEAPDGYNLMEQLEDGVGITEESFNYTGGLQAQLTAAAYTIEVSMISDYSSDRAINTEDIGKQRDFKQNNLVPLNAAGSSDYKTIVRTSNPPPSLPGVIDAEGDNSVNSAIFVTWLSNASLGTYLGEGHYQNNLEPDTIVGIIAQANYLNSGALLRKLNYFCFLRSDYETYHDTGTGPRDPMEANIASQKISTNVSAQSTATPKVLFLFGSAPVGQNEDGTTTIDGELVNYRYMGTNYIRGNKYVLAYTAAIDPKGTNETQNIIESYYPYRMSTYRRNLVLHRFITVKYQEPIIYGYQKRSGQNTATWSLCVSDPDAAIPDNERYVLTGNATQQPLINKDGVFHDVTFTNILTNTFQIQIQCRELNASVETAKVIPVISQSMKAPVLRNDSVQMEYHSVENNYLPFVLTGTNAVTSVLRNSACLKLVMEQDAETETFYLRLGEVEDQAENMISRTAMLYVSLLPTDWIGKQVSITAASLMYDSENNGFGDAEERGTNLYSLQRVSATGVLENYMTVSFDKKTIDSSGTDIDGSVFKIDSLIPNTEDGKVTFHATNICADYIGSPLNLSMNMTEMGFLESLYKSGAAATEYLTAKKLSENPILSSSITFTIAEITPSISRQDSWEPGLGDIKASFTVYGLNQGKKLFIMLTKGSITDSGMYEYLSENRVLAVPFDESEPNVQDTYYNWFTVDDQGQVEVQIKGLMEASKYRIEAFYENNAGNLVSVLDYSDNSPFSDLAETKSEIVISNIKTKYSAVSYKLKQLELTYSLDFFSGFEMKYDLWRKYGETWLLAMSHEDLMDEGCIENDSAYTESNSKFIDILPGSNIKTGVRYKLVLRAVSSSDSSVEISSGETPEFVIPRAPLPSFFVTTTASFVESNSPDKHKLITRCYVSDAYKAITDGIEGEEVFPGEYAIRVYNPSGAEITPSHMKETYYKSTEVNNFELTGLYGNTTYKIVFYAVIDRNNLGRTGDPIQSIRDVREEDFADYAVSEALETTLNDYGIRTGTVSLRSNRGTDCYYVNFSNASGLGVINGVEYSISYMSDSGIRSIKYNVLDIGPEAFEQKASDYYELKLPCENVTSTGMHYITMKLMIDNQIVETFSFNCIY